MVDQLGSIKVSMPSEIRSYITLYFVIVFWSNDKVNVKTWINLKVEL